MKVADPLQWTCPETTVEDWDNVPPTSVQITLYLLRHCEAVVSYLNDLKKLETTSSLRTYSVNRMNANDDRLHKFETATNNELDLRLKKDLAIEQKLDEFILDTNYNKKYWTYTQVNQSIYDLYEQEVTDEERQEDSTQGGDWLIPQDTQQARMYSLEQQQELWHLHFKKSSARKRLDKNDFETAEVRYKMQDMRSWRDNFETKFSDYQQNIQSLFNQVNKHHKDLVTRCDFEFNECHLQTAINNDRNYQTKQFIDEQFQDNQDVQKKLDQLNKRIKEQGEEIYDSARKQYLNFDRDIERLDLNFTQQAEKTNRTLERTRSDVIELINQKHDFIIRQNNIELQELREAYEKAVASANEASKKLIDIFKQKMVKVKSRLAKFFAEIEIKITENNLEVAKIGNIVSHSQDRIQGPVQKNEAMLYSFQQLLIQGERDREAQFTHLKESIRHLIRTISGGMERVVSTERLSLNSRNLTGAQSIDAEMRNGNRRGSVPLTVSQHPLDVQYEHLPLINPSRTKNVTAGSEESQDLQSVIFFSKMKQLEHNLDAQPAAIPVPSRLNDYSPKGFQNILHTERKVKSSLSNNQSESGQIQFGNLVERTLPSKYNKQKHARFYDIKRIDDLNQVKQFILTPSKQERDDLQSILQSERRQFQVKRVSSQLQQKVSPKFNLPESNDTLQLKQSETQSPQITQSKFQKFKVPDVNHSLQVDGVVKQAAFDVRQSTPQNYQAKKDLQIYNADETQNRLKQLEIELHQKILEKEKNIRAQQRRTSNHTSLL